MKLQSHCSSVILLLLVSWSAQLVDSRRRGRGKFKRGYSTERRPNIIFIMADDLDVTLGSPEVMYKTNRLLRQEGVTFKNAFTTSPLCCPSRSSILTGRYTHNHHVHSNNRNCSGPGWIKTEEKETFGKFMQDAGYQTAYFGKYLNNYDGKRVPPGWNHWSGLVRNSRYYNYSLNVNGRLERYGGVYKKDYFSNVITSESSKYFTKHTTKHPSKPLLMVVSHSAPHGPEDAAPQHQNLFENVTAPRHPNYNYTSPDKHWIIRTTPPLSQVTSAFTDILHRKRLQTLMALDDAIEQLHLMLIKTNQLHNTYVIFTSDHGYHLGQFNQVKGKSQPYESDIRIPLYMRGPKIPRGAVVEDIALNIDFAPTFLDIANVKVPKIMDGSSLMDVAVGSLINTVNRKVLKPIWKDTFLVERGKMKKLPPSINTSQEISVDQLVFPSARKIKKMCLRNGFPKPPCTPYKKFVCYSKDKTWYIQNCKQGENNGGKKTTQCSCNSGASNGLGDNRKVLSLLLQLERHFEKLKRRIKRHGLKYFNTIFKSKQDLLQPAVKGKPLNLTSSAKHKINIINQTLVTMSKKQKLEQILDQTIQKKIEELEYWQKKREKLAQNRKIKKTLEKKLTQKIAKENKNRKLEDLDGVNKHSNTTVSSTSSCVCGNPQQQQQQPSSKKRKKKKHSSTIGRHMNCFHFTKKHWKTKPLWDGPSFTACTNSPNSSYWCLRTINPTHNFLYCEFITGFKEYFDINEDPYQLVNIVDTIPKTRMDDLHKQLVYLKACRGAKGCFLKSGQSFTNRKDMLRKWRRYERKKRHGIFVRSSIDSKLKLS